jgi:hypothetical protein
MKNTSKKSGLYKYLHKNSDNSKIICNLCEQSYSIKTSYTVIKRHFLNHHKKEYEEFLTQEQKQLIQKLDNVEKNNIEKDNNQAKITNFYKSNNNNNSISFNNETEQKFYLIVKDTLYTYNAKNIKIIYE